MGQRDFPALLVGGSAMTFAAVFYLSGPTAAPASAVPVEAAASTGPEMGASEKIADAETLAQPAPDTSVYYAGCDEVRAAGKAPLYAQQPGHHTGMDGDGDGIACEPYSGSSDGRSGGRRRFRRH